MFADTANPDRPPDNTVAMPPIPRRAALYVDTEAGAREQSLRRVAEAQGLEIVAVYRAGEEGGLARVVVDAQADHFDALVVANRSVVAAGGMSYASLHDAVTEVSVRVVIADAIGR